MWLKLCRFLVNCACFTRKDQTSDHLEDADFADYDYKQVLINWEGQQENEGEKLDKEGVLDEEGDGNHSYGEDLDFDDYDDQDGDESDDGCGDRSHSRHSDTSRASDEGKRSASRHGSQESMSGETEGKERGEEKNGDKEEAISFEPL